MSISAMTAPWLNTFFSAQLPALGAAPFYVNVSKVIIKRCTPLGSKCTPHRPFVKWYRGVKRKRLHGDHFRITVEPVIVKKYRKTLVNRGFCKKKLDTRFDTHCIKTGVQLWCGHGDSNPNVSLHENLNLACLPIPSCPHVFIKSVDIFGYKEAHFHHIKYYIIPRPKEQEKNPPTALCGSRGSLLWPEHTQQGT